MSNINYNSHKYKKFISKKFKSKQIGMAKKKKQIIDKKIIV